MLRRCSSSGMRALGLGRGREFARCASTLVVAEHNNATLSPSSLSAVTAAAELKGDITMLVLGHEAHDVAQQVRSEPSHKTSTL